MDEFREKGRDFFSFVLMALFVALVCGAVVFFALGGFSKMASAPRQQPKAEKVAAKPTPSKTRQPKPAAEKPKPAQTKQEIINRYEDELIRIEANFNLFVARYGDLSYKFAFDGQEIFMTPITLKPKEDFRKHLGSLEGSSLVVKDINGTLFTSVVPKYARTTVHYVIKGSTLFVINAENAEMAFFEKLFGCVTFLDYANPVELQIEVNRGIDEFTIPNSTLRLKSKTFSQFRVRDGFLATDMFEMQIPPNWEACNTSEFIFMFDRSSQSEQVSIFTLQSVKLDKESFGRFLDKVFGSHSEFSSLKAGPNECILTSVQAGQKQMQVVLMPINRDFGIMLQSRSKTGSLTDEAKRMIASIKFK